MNYVFLSGEKEELPLPLNGNSLMDIVEQLKRTPVGLDTTLGRTVPFGVAYHHAGNSHIHVKINKLYLDLCQLLVVTT